MPGTLSERTGTPGEAAAMMMEAEIRGNHSQEHARSPATLQLERGCADYPSETQKEPALLTLYFGLKPLEL